jgi:hypothetical protein
MNHEKLAKPLKPVLNAHPGLIRAEVDQFDL